VATIDVVDLEGFVAVMRASSFARAAKSLPTQKAHLSRVIRARQRKTRRRMRRARAGLS
jgi:DNA-binding transcriptional LysR family regulator